jgi:hypothetical protein
VSSAAVVPQRYYGCNLIHQFGFVRRLHIVERFAIF